MYSIKLPITPSKCYLYDLSAHEDYSKQYRCYNAETFLLKKHSRILYRPFKSRGKTGEEDKEARVGRVRSTGLKAESQESDPSSPWVRDAAPYLGDVGCRQSQFRSKGMPVPLGAT